MDLVFTLLKGLVMSMLWGIVFLILAVLLLPDRIFVRLLKRIKPDFTSRSLVLARVKTVLDYLLNKKDIVVEESHSPDIKVKQEEMADLIKEKTILESNLFFLDFLKSLAGMTHFSVLHAGYGEMEVCNLLEQEMEYLQYYTKWIKDSASSSNLRERIDLSAERLQSQVSDTARLLSTNIGEEKVKIAISTLKQGTKSFDSFMHAEYDSTHVQLTRINQILADLFIEYIGQEL